MIYCFVKIIKIRIAGSNIVVAFEKEFSSILEQVLLISLVRIVFQCLIILLDCCFILLELSQPVRFTLYLLSLSHLFSFAERLQLVFIFAPLSNPLFLCFKESFDVINYHF